MKLSPETRKWLAEIGRKGGKKSKRKITPEQQAKMQKGRAKEMDEHIASHVKKAERKGKQNG